MSRIVGLLALTPLCLAASCFGSNDGVGDGGARPCVDGLSLSCTCADGRHGASTCQADGTMTACVCAGASPAGMGSAASGGGGMDTTTGGPTGGGTQAQPSGGQGGAGGAGETGGTSGGGSGGGGGGEPDAGTDAGNTPPPDAGPGMDGKPKPGEAYAPCMTTTDCHGNLECAAPPFASGGRGHCTLRCRENFGMVAECPAPPSGSVGVMCAALSGLCQLGSCEKADCPEGMECRDQFVPSLPFGRTVYYCAYGD